MTTSNITSSREIGWANIGDTSWITTGSVNGLLVGAKGIYAVGSFSGSKGETISRWDGVDWNPVEKVFSTASVWQNVIPEAAKGYFFEGIPINWNCLYACMSGSDGLYMCASYYDNNYDVASNTSFYPKIRKWDGNIWTTITSSEDKFPNVAWQQALKCMLTCSNGVYFPFWQFMVRYDGNDYEKIEYPTTPEDGEYYFIKSIITASDGIYMWSDCPYNADHENNRFFISASFMKYDGEAWELNGEYIFDETVQFNWQGINYLPYAQLLSSSQGIIVSGLNRGYGIWDGENYQINYNHYIDPPTEPVDTNNYVNYLPTNQNLISCSEGIYILYNNLDHNEYSTPIYPINLILWDGTSWSQKISDADNIYGSVSTRNPTNLFSSSNGIYFYTSIVDGSSVYLWNGEKVVDLANYTFGSSPSLAAGGKLVIRNNSVGMFYEQNGNIHLLSDQREQPDIIFPNFYTNLGNHILSVYKPIDDKNFVINSAISMSDGFYLAAYYPDKDRSCVYRYDENRLDILINFFEGEIRSLSKDENNNLYAAGNMKNNLSLRLRPDQFSTQEEYNKLWSGPSVLSFRVNENYSTIRNWTDKWLWGSEKDIYAPANVILSASEGTYIAGEFISSRSKNNNEYLKYGNIILAYPDYNQDQNSGHSDLLGGLNGTINTLYSSSNYLYAGGEFYGSDSGSYLSKWDGIAWSSMSINLPGPVKKISPVYDGFYVNGYDNVNNKTYVYKYANATDTWSDFTYNLTSSALNNVNGISQFGGYTHAYGTNGIIKTYGTIETQILTIDSCEQYTSSYERGSGATWNYRLKNTKWDKSGGDYYTSSYVYTCDFKTGLEDLEIDVTELVENWLDQSGSANNGFMIKLSDEFEDGRSGQSFYTKKFSARGSEFFYKRPIIEVRWEDAIKDDRNNFFAASNLLSEEDNTQNLFFYNRVNGKLKNIYGNPELQIKFYTDSNYTDEIIDHTSSITNPYPGIYRASTVINTTSSVLYDRWYQSGSLSNIYYSNFVDVNHYEPQDFYSDEQYIYAITNLKTKYSSNENATIRIFSRLKNWSPNIYSVAVNNIENTSIKDLYYKIYRIDDGYEVIPYSIGSIAYSKTSYDARGNYFNLDMSLLEPDYSYAIQLARWDGNILEEFKQIYKFRVE